MLWAIEIAGMRAHEVVTSAKDSIILFEFIVLLSILLYESIDEIELFLQLCHPK